jgi:hypothetical protein
VLCDNKLYVRSISRGVCFQFSTSAPTCTIGTPSITLTNTGPVDYAVTFSESVTGFDSAADIQVNATDTAAAGSVSIVSGSGAGPYTVRLSLLTGSGTLGIAVKADACAGASGGNAASDPSATFTVDNGAPTVSTGAPSVSLTSTGPVDYSVTFSEAVTGFSSATDLQINATGTAAVGSISIFGGSGAGPYTVRLSSLTGNGTLGITVKAGACSDAVGNSNAVGSPSATFTVDNTSPTASVGSPSPALIRSGPVEFSVTFSKSVTGFSSSDDVEVNATGTAAAGSVAVVSGSGAGPYTVRLASLTGNGTLGVTVKAGACQDALGHANTASSASATCAVDNTAPAAEVSLSDSNPTNTNTVRFAVNFSEDVDATFGAADITVTGTLASSALVGVTGGPRNYTVAVTPTDPNADGTLGIEIAATGVSDAAGNIFGGALSALYTVDNTQPAVSIGLPSVLATAGGPVTYALDVSLATSVATNEDILTSLTLNATGTASGTLSVTGSGIATRTVTISDITGDGTLSITVLRGIAVNGVGVRTEGAGPSEAVTVDNTAPMATIDTPSVSLTRSGPVDYSVTFSEAVTGFDSPDDVELSVAGTATAGEVSIVSGSGMGPYVVRLSGIAGDGALGITIKAAACDDEAGNGNTVSAASGTCAVDNSAPTAIIGSPSLPLTQSGPVEYTVTFDEAVTGFDSADDIELDATGTAAVGEVSIVSGSGAGPYVVRLSGIMGNGTLGIVVKASACGDEAGNENAASAASETFAVNNHLSKAGVKVFGGYK